MRQCRHTFGDAAVRAKRAWRGAACLLLLTSACGPQAGPAAAIDLALDRIAAPQGGVITASLTLRALPAGGPLDDDYRVFVHFLDADGRYLWADDHDPPIPSSRWPIDAPVSYDYRMTLPEVGYTGETTIAVGLYQVQRAERLPLAGEHLGQRAYRGASITIEPATARNLVEYGEGWYEPESASPDGPRWRWSSAAAGFSFANPYTDAVLHLDLGGRPDLTPDGRQQVEVVAGGEVIRTVALDTTQRREVELVLPAAQLGTGRTAHVELRVQPTFVPAAVTGDSIDERPLGIRLHRAFVDVR